MPVGVLLLAVSSGWLDVIRGECGRGRFFPGKTLNACGSVLFHWLWIFPTTGVLLALCNWGPFTSLHLDVNEQIWNKTILVFIPLALMLLGRSVEPYTFKRARTDVLRAEMLVRQLLAGKSKAASGANDVPLLLDVDAVPFYRPSQWLFSSVCFCVLRLVMCSKFFSSAFFLLLWFVLFGFVCCTFN